ncbi:amino acid ABC transporter permease [Acidipropionibacterium virtanenii]|uniref:L-cystine transport system permease protein YecS n=1 Tax=Acidipropionibacterium virtanenii TaxID=2057246 RepID=A0A344UXH5_9ACTN|nr:amino acid ABC transporter permease [Acidipropionibacterium virtanenii]AXE39973.1 L-cystine transport system permease protein YecS [Acidipropionibacterium virtanenii]
MSNSVLFDVPGPRALRRHRAIGVIGVVLGLVLAALLIYGLRSQLGWDAWSAIFTGGAWLNYFLPGILNTLQAAAASLVLASILGFILALGRMSFVRPVRWICSVLVEFFRAVPVLMAMLFFYYLMVFAQPFDTLVDPALKGLVGVIAGLTFYNGAVMAELLRAGVNSLPRGQTEAGLSVGLSLGQTRTMILLPQAITAMMPALVSQLVIIVKDTALGYIITYPELLRSATNLSSGGTNIIPVFLVAALLFIIINYALSNFAEHLQDRMRRRRGGHVVTIEEAHQGSFLADEGALEEAVDQHRAD